MSLARQSVKGLLLDTSVVRHHLTALVPMVERLVSAGVEVGIPAPMYAEMLHQREQYFRAGGRRKVKKFFAADALTPLLERARVIPFTEEAAKTLANWSAAEYTTPEAYRIHKKLVTVQRATDVFGEAVRTRFHPVGEEHSWHTSHWREVWFDVERRVRALQFKKDGVTAVDWLAAGLAIHLGWHVVTTDKGVEFERLRHWRLDVDALHDLVATVGEE